MGIDNIRGGVRVARISRERSKTGIYHAMLRGINRTTIFEDNEDREYFLDKLNFFKEKNKYSLHGYCLMSNHVHLLLQEVEDEISTSIKRICSSYVLWYNNKYERCGHLFQERFKSEAVESDDYFLTVLRYIHQNPSKAGMIEKVKNSNWSSYNGYIGKYNITDTGLGLSLFSDDTEKARELFVNHHTEANEDKCLDYDDFIRLTDDEARREIVKRGIRNLNALQHLEKSNRDYILRKLKDINGVSIRQLSRITGISKSVIDRA